jgi:hypothetical protein
VQAAFLNGSDSFREWRGWPPAGSGLLSTMIMSACAAIAGARYPPGGVWRDSALSRRGSNDRPARCARLPASGPEIVRQEAAENRVGALGGQPFLADLVGNMRRHPGGRSPSAASSMPLRRGWKLRHATPNVFAVSRGIGRQALGRTP